MRWYGDGTNPVEYQQFLRGLSKATSPKRLAEALKLLRTSPLTLLGDLSLDALHGIVQGASARHACGLREDGAFGCCTADLRPCATAKEPCVHLLVLLLGLAKSNELEMEEMVTWLAASRKAKPFTDTTRLNSLFQRQTAVEKGDGEWRPTETTTESFAAM
jgi:hypothetical protein